MCITIDKIKDESKAKLNKLSAELATAYPENSFNNICVYACGSMGRLDMVKKTDLDLFFITMDEKINLSETERDAFFEKLLKINNKLEYGMPTQKYWKFTRRSDLLHIGSQEEDYKNSFTARLLLILESKPIYNERAYDLIVTETINAYFKDFPRPEGEKFHPLFLMNDILRYWYTLTSNYEYRRDPNDSRNKKNWRRLKLKYARFITCFSMIACLYDENPSPDVIIKYIKMTPFERLREISSRDSELQKLVAEIEKEYIWFLELRRVEDEAWWNNREQMELAYQKADSFHFIFKNFMKALSDRNPNFHHKTDIW